MTVQKNGTKQRTKYGVPNHSRKNNRTSSPPRPKGIYLRPQFVSEYEIWVGPITEGQGQGMFSLFTPYLCDDLNFRTKAFLGSDEIIWNTGWSWIKSINIKEQLLWIIKSSE